jgi:tetratricopeptide (TPR) repeat protein
MLRARTRVALLDYDGAVVDMTNALELDSDYQYGYRMRGYYNHEIKEFDAALNDLNKAISLDSLDHYSFYNRGRTYSSMENLSAAFDDFNRAIELCDSVASYYSQRGVALSLMDDLNGGLLDFNKAIELDSTIGIFYINRGYSYFSLGRLEESLVEFNRGFELIVPDASDYIKRGRLLAKMEEYDEAIADFTEAMILDPGDPMVYYYRAYALMLKDDFLAAKVDIEKSLALRGKERDPEFLSLRAFIAFELEEYNSAIWYFSVLIDEFESHDLYEYRAEAYEEIGELEKAEHDYSKYIDYLTDDHKEYAYITRAFFYLRMDEHEKALNDINACIKLKPSEPYYYFKRGTCYYGLGLEQKACESYSKALELGYEEATPFVEKFCE